MPYEEGGSLGLWLILGAVPLWLVHLAGLVWAVCYLRRCTWPAVCVIVASLLAVVSWLLLPMLFQWYHRRVWDYGEGIEWLDFWMRVHAVVSGWLSAVIWGLMLAAALGWRKRAGGAVSTSAGPVDVPSPAVAAQGFAGVGAAPPVASAGVALPVKPISKPLYLSMVFGSFALSLLLAFPGLVMMYGSRDEGVQIAGGALACGAALPSVFGVVWLMMLVFKMWSAVQGGVARTTPGKAVGFLFIPLFNFYWVFQAYWGWAVDYNRGLAAHGVTGPRMPEGVALAVCVLAVASVVPMVGMLIGVVNFVPMVWFFGRAIDGVNALAASGGVGPRQGGGNTPGV